MSKVLVTGANGFLGRNVLPSLIERGYEVHAACRTITAGLRTDTVQWHQTDLLDPVRRRHLLDSVRPAGLVHLAWIADHGTYWSSEQNLDWTAASILLLREFCAGGGRRVVIAGTSAEYEWLGPEPLDEERTPISPRGLYGHCKNALREIVQAWAPAAGVSWAWGRIFNIYGPDEKAEKLVPRIIRALLRGDRLDLGNENLVRDFLHVRDAGDAFAAIYASELQGPVNVASGNPVEIRTLLNTISAYIESGSEICRDSSRPAVVSDAHVVGSVRKLTQEIGWKPGTELAQGLRETCDWWRNRITA